VRGAWVIKSSQISPPMPMNLQNIRNFLLLRYAIGENEYIVHRKELADQIPTTAAIIKTLLQPISINIKGKGWKLKVDADADFEKKHAVTVDKYNKSWHSGKKRILDALATPTAASASTVQSASSGAAHGAALPHLGGAPTTEQALRDVTEFVTSMLSTYGLLTIMQLKQKLDRTAKGEEKSFPLLVVTPEVLKQHPRLLQDALTHVANKLNSSYYLKSTGEPVRDTVWLILRLSGPSMLSPSLFQVRNAVISLFQKQNVYAQAELTSQLNAALGNRQLDQGLVDRCVREFANLKSGKFVFKANAGSGDA